TKSCDGRKTWCSDAPIRSQHPEAEPAISGQAAYKRRGAADRGWPSRRSATTKRRPLNQVIVLGNVPKQLTQSVSRCLARRRGPRETMGLVHDDKVPPDLPEAG